MSENKSVNRLFLITVVIYIGVSFLTGALIPPEVPIYVHLMISQALIIVPVLIYCKIQGIKLRELIPFRKMKISTTVLVIVCTYLIYPLLIVCNVFSLFWTQSQTVDVLSAMGGENLALNGIMMAAIPAMVEEMMFRGVIYQTYRRTRVFTGALLSAFLFGCMHMNFNQFIYTFVFGIYLALLVEATGSIFSSMLAHFTLNFTSVLMLFIVTKISPAVAGAGAIPGNFTGTMDAASLGMLLMGVFLLACIALGTTAGAVGVYIGLSTTAGRYEYVKQMFKKHKEERMISIALVVAIIIAFAMMLFIEL
ncbi:CPBP family intramembrane metalloprotease [Lachnospiraceae bacterium ZAX-1]